MYTSNSILFLPVIPGQDSDRQLRNEENNDRGPDGQIKCQIFIDEKEIKGDYEVIAFLTYSSPVFPIFMSAKKR